MMIGLVIVAHGGFGQSLIENATHVLGQRPQRLETVRVEASDAPARTQAQVEQAIVAVDDGAGVLVLVDICGATPCNVVTQLQSNRVEVVTGASLPMLLRALSYRQQTLQQVVEKALSGGREGVMRMTNEKIDATSAN